MDASDGCKVLDLFHALSEVIAAEEVRMSGAWSAKGGRDQVSCGGEPAPHAEMVSWRWDGVFESAAPLVGISLLVHREHCYWVKSPPPVARLEVSFTTSGWTAPPCSVFVTGSLHGTYLPAIPVQVTEGHAASCYAGQPVTTTGVPHLVGRLVDVTFAVVLLPASAIKVGRNRLWHLRERVASQLPSELQKLMTRGRSGKIGEEAAADGR